MSQVPRTASRGVVDAALAVRGNAPAPPFGSLATMLWLALVRKRGVTVSAGAYTRIGLLVTPPMLLAATLVLWLVLRVSPR